MSTRFEQLVSEAGQAGREAHSAWNSELFTEAIQGPAEFLWNKSGSDVATVQSYLRLIIESIGQGCLTQAVHPQHAKFFVGITRWHCLLEYWLNLTIPLEIPALPPTQRVPAMARLWNLGENILRDEPWIDPFLLKKVLAQPPALANLEQQIGTWLEPLLQPARSATWRPPFAVQVIDGRRVQADFLPGEMQRGSNSVVCVRDRRLEGVYAGVFLHENPSEIIAHHRSFGTAAAPPPSVPVEFQPGQVMINGHLVALPFLTRVHSHLICDPGAILVSAVDSQRLWIVRCS